MAQELLDAKADVQEYTGGFDNAPLSYAVGTTRGGGPYAPELLRFLLGQGLEADAMNQRNSRTLSYAADGAIAKVLLEAKASLKHPEDCSPLLHSLCAD